MSLKTDAIISQLALANRNNAEIEAKLTKHFDKNIILGSVLAIASLVAIFYFEVSINSGFGFLILLAPIFFLLMIAFEISHNMSVAALKSEQLVRLTGVLIQIEIESQDRVNPE